MTRMISRACPVCAEDRQDELWRKGELRLVRCSGCSMVYASPVDESLASGEFYDQLATPFYLSPDKLAGDYAPVRFDREIKLFRRFCDSGSVLDVGCSTGAFLARLQRQFGTDYDVTGVDVAGPALDYAAAQGVPVRRESFLTPDFGGKHFRAVTFWAVLEHVAEPGAFLARAADVLEPGGFCFILVPNFQSLAVRVLGVKYRYILPQHVNYFTAATLRRLISTEPRFRAVYEGSSHLNPLVIWRDWAGKTVSDEDRARLLKQTTAYKQNPALKPARLALAGMEKILCQLNLADNLVIVLQQAG